MRCASIAVGIVRYADAHYRDSDMRLQFACDDAKAFSHYSTLAGDRQDDNLLLLDGDATIEGLTKAFAQIAALPPTEVFFLYLSGHGEQGTGGQGWFCLVDAKPGIPSLNAGTLDILLAKVKARHVVVLIDCCYAEAVVRRMHFFSWLDGGLGRLFIVSARTDQRSWEDEGLRRSLFSDVLLRALSTDSSIVTSDGHVDVDSALLPHLREQVPLIASARKQGHIQEPVSGGVCAAELTLPTVTSRSLGRRLTTAEAVRLNVRRVLVGLAVAAIAFLALLDVFVFHLAADATGRIEVRPGLSSSYNLQPLHLASVKDTGLKIADLDPLKSDFFKDLARGSLVGYRTHLDDGGLRPWLALLEPALQRRPKASVAALARGEINQFDPGDDIPPVIEALFLARLKQPQRIDREALYPNKRAVEPECNENAVNRVDFSLLSSGPEVFTQDVLWAVATAPSAGEPLAAHLLRLVKLNAYRYLHQRPAKDDQRLEEFRAFGLAIGAILSRADLPALRQALKHWPQVEDSWCKLPLAFVLAMAGDAAQSHQAELRLWQVFESYDRDQQGDLATASQAVALQALAEVARRRPLDPAKVRALGDKVIANAVDITSNIPPHQLIWEIALARPLPDNLVDFLLAKLDKAPDVADFEPLTAIRVLSCNVAFLHDGSRGKVKEWIDKNAEANRTMSDMHQALGCAALLWPPSQAHVAILIGRLSPASVFSPRAVNYRGETIISANGDIAAVALGKIAQKHELDADTILRLSNIAGARPTLTGREEILAGLAAASFGKVASVDAVYRIIVAAGNDAVQRELATDVILMSFAHQGLTARDAIARDLISLWTKETEPEIRVALARVIGLLTMAQERPLPHHSLSAGGCDCARAGRAQAI